MKTITVTFPEVKIKVGIEKMSFDTLENMIHEIGDQIKELVMERTLRDIDDELRINRQKGLSNSIMYSLKTLFSFKSFFL